MAKNTKQLPTIEEKMAKRRKEIEETFREIIKMMDDYMHAAPLAFIEGSDACPADYLDVPGTAHFNKFDPWVDRWMGALYPRALELQESINLYNKQPDERCDYDATYMELSFTTLRFGYLLGYLMGCRSMGVRGEELLTRAMAFTIGRLGEEEFHEQGLAEEKQKKSAA